MAPLPIASGPAASSLFCDTVVPEFFVVALRPDENTPYCVRLISHPMTALLLLPVPPGVMNEIVVPANPAPTSVWLLSLPTSTRFLSVMFVVASPVELVCPQITALAGDVLELVMVRSRVEPPGVFEPSRVT